MESIAFGSVKSKPALDVPAKIKASFAMTTEARERLKTKTSFTFPLSTASPQDSAFEGGLMDDHSRETIVGEASTLGQNPAEVKSTFESRESSSDSVKFVTVKSDLRPFLHNLIEKAKEDGLEVILDGFEDDDFEGTGNTDYDGIEFTIVKSNFKPFLTDLIAKAKQDGFLDSLDGIEESEAVDSTSSEEQAFASPQKIVSTKEPTYPSPASPRGPAINFPNHLNDSSSLVGTDGSASSNLEDQVPSSPHKLSATQRQSLQSPSLCMVNVLCQLMDKTFLDRSDQPVAKRITITKAYKFNMVHNPKCHYDSVAYLKAGINNREVTGKKRKRGDLGFKPHEVIKKGALHTADLHVECTLRGDIHSIFDEIHFTDCPHDVYIVIKPALLLASKFLTTPQCLQHFQTVLKGNREYCFETSFRVAQDRYRIRKDVPLTPEALENLKRQIDSLAGSLLWQFLDAGLSMGGADVYFATTKIIPCKHNRSEYLNNSSSSMASSPQKTLVSIHPDFYIEAKRLCRLKYPDPAQALRFQFFLAVNIMHEFAHAFEIACSPDDARMGKEVFMYDFRVAESGRAWEVGIFGGWLSSISDRSDALLGLGLLEWPEPGLKDPSKAGQTEIWAVPMDYIKDLLQQKFWDTISKKPLGDKALFHVPKTGARSIALCSLTTAKFEEILEEREMSSLELALRDIEGDEEERARKRRRGMFVPQSWRKALGRRGGRDF